MIRFYPSLNGKKGARDLDKIEVLGVLVLTVKNVCENCEVGEGIRESKFPFALNEL